MAKGKCVRCGASIPPDNPELDSMGLVDNKKLWEQNASKWCVGCQREFLTSHRDYVEKTRWAVEAQDGTPHEIRRFGLSISGLKKSNIGYKPRRKEADE